MSKAGTDLRKKNGSDVKGFNNPVVPPEVLYSPAMPQEQLRILLTTVKAMRKGDFTVRMPGIKEGIISEIGEVLNDIIELNESMANEFVRVRSTVGQEGKMTERV